VTGTAFVVGSILSLGRRNSMPEISEETLAIIKQYGIPAVKVLLIIVAALLIGSWANRVVRGACEKAKIDDTLARFFGKAARWGILLLAAMFCISVFEIETAGFAVVLGAAGLAIGLAFQGTLSNLASGIMLLIFRPFKVGDFVNVAGQSGKVDEIELFSTTFDTPDNRRIITPNSAIFGAQIENITYHDTRRVDVNVGVEYSADIDKTRQVLEAAAAGVEGCADDPPQSCHRRNLPPSRGPANPPRLRLHHDFGCCPSPMASWAATPLNASRSWSHSIAAAPLARLARPITIYPNRNLIVSPARRHLRPAQRTNRGLPPLRV